MAEPTKPLLFGGENSEDWFDWLNNNYHALDLKGKKTPGYVMIMGGPKQVPSAFQSLLQTGASVGRPAGRALAAGCLGGGGGRPRRWDFRRGKRLLPVRLLRVRDARGERLLALARRRSRTDRGRGLRRGAADAALGPSARAGCLRRPSRHRLPTWLRRRRKPAQPRPLAQSHRAL